MDERILDGLRGEPARRRRARAGLSALILWFGISLGPAPAEAGDELDDGGWLAPTSGTTYGSLQYAVGVVEVGLAAGVLPAGGGLGWGYHYAERGSLLAQLLLGATSAAGAGVRAAQTGRSQVYYVDTSPNSSAHIRFDLLSNDQATSYLLDVGYGFPIENRAHRPWIVDLGCGGGALEAPDLEGDASYVGFYLGLLAPVTRYAQLEALVRGHWSDQSWYSWEVGAVGNLGNRYYLRLRAQGFAGTTLAANLGVRL